MGDDYDIVTADFFVRSESELKEEKKKRLIDRTSLGLDEERREAREKKGETNGCWMKEKKKKKKEETNEKKEEGNMAELSRREGRKERRERRC